jgi:hypothetical protein
MAAYLIRRNVRFFDKQHGNWEAKQGSIVEVPDWVQSSKGFELLKKDAMAAGMDDVAKQATTVVSVEAPKKGKKLDFGAP